MIAGAVVLAAGILYMGLSGCWGALDRICRALERIADALERPH